MGDPSPKRFVIIAAPRTGSTHLVNLLGRQPDIFCHGEVFGKKRVLFRGRKNVDPGVSDELMALRQTDREVFLERIFGMNEGRQHTGFKIFQGHDDSALERLVNDHAVRKILLYRRNLLAAYASALAAKKTGVWGARAKSTTGKQKVTFKANQFIRFHNRRTGFYAAQIGQITDTGQQCYWLDYEDINNPIRLRCLLLFIGAQHHLRSRSSTVERRSPNEICARFENAKEVETFLSRNRLMHWSYEGEAWGALGMDTDEE